MTARWSSRGEPPTCPTSIAYKAVEEYGIIELAYKTLNNKETLHIFCSFNALYAKCSYILVLYMQSVLIIY